MSEPVCVQNSPIRLELEPGQYWWCACGLSKKHPFCDGTHKSTDITPVNFRLDEKKAVWLCACKRTAGAPMCDGSHKTPA